MWQDKYLNNNDTHRDQISFSIRCTIVIQRDDGGPWMHGMIVNEDSTDHNGQSYKVRVMKTDRLIAGKARHIWEMPRTTEWYLRQQIMK